MDGLGQVERAKKESIFCHFDWLSQVGDWTNSDRYIHNAIRVLPHNIIKSLAFSNS